MTVWTGTYDYGTFEARHGGITCWASNRRRLVDDLGPGDLVVPYVARIGWVGIWRVTSTARRDASGSPFGDQYPIVAEVTEDLTLPLESAMRPADIPRPSILRQDDGLGAPLPYLFQSSGIGLADEVGAELVRLITEWAESPTERTLTSKQVQHRTAERAETPAGTVTIPADDDESDVEEDTGIQADVSDHTAAQRKLLELGNVLGFTPWVTPDDQSKVADPTGTTLSELPGVTTLLPEQFNDATNRTIRHIDVMWLQRSRIEAAFEVENSTSIYSGILRMADLLALQPNIDVPLYLVVPDVRLDKALQELQRPVFVNMQRPLHESCRVLTYESLEELTDLAVRAGGALRIDVVAQYSEAVSDRSGE